MDGNKELPTYWTDELKGLSVFDVIKDTLNKCPEILDELVKFIKGLEVK